MTDPVVVAPDPEAAGRLIETGRRIAQTAHGCENIGPLYDRHAELFGLPPEPLKSFVIDGLRKQASWEAALDALAQAVKLDPTNVSALEDLASVLEQSGRLDDVSNVRRNMARLAPLSLSNQIALGRVYERTQPWKAVTEHYLRVFKTSDWLLLAQCRHLALSRSSEINGATLADLRRWVHAALETDPGDTTLHLALGFIDIAEHDLAAARHSFLTASTLVATSAPQPDPRQRDLFDGEPTADIRYDPWSLAFAQAFLLDLLPSDWSRGAMWVPIDRVRLGLVRAALLRLQGAVLSALEQYDAAVTELVRQPRPRLYSIYKGYRIAVCQGRFYAVPMSIGNFSITDGAVIRLPGHLEQTKPWLIDWLDPRWRGFAGRISRRLRRLPRQLKQAKDRLADRLDPRSRAFAGRIWRRSGRPIARCLVRITDAISLKLTPLTGAAFQKLTALAIHVYIKAFTVPAILVEADVLTLRQRIDALPRDANEADPRADHASLQDAA